MIQYSASSVPILQIGLNSKTIPEQQLNDYALNFVRTQLITVEGAAIPFPYGGKQRVISVDLDTAAMQAKHLTPVDVVNAISAQNLILPSGTAKLGALEHQVELNASPQTVAELNDLPIRIVNGTTIYVHDVAHVRDGFSPQLNIVRQDGIRGTLAECDEEWWSVHHRHRQKYAGHASASGANLAGRRSADSVVRSILICPRRHPGRARGRL